MVAEDHTQLGSGFIAAVHRGSYAGMPVAVKMLHPAMFGKSANQDNADAGQELADEGLAALANEVKMLGRCRHPRVVRLLGAGGILPGPRPRRAAAENGNGASPAVSSGFTPTAGLQAAGAGQRGGPFVVMELMQSSLHTLLYGEEGPTEVAASTGADHEAACQAAGPHQQLGAAAADPSGDGSAMHAHALPALSLLQVGVKSMHSANQQIAMHAWFV